MPCLPTISSKIRVRLQSELFHKVEFPSFGDSFLGLETHTITLGLSSRELYQG